MSDKPHSRTNPNFKENEKKRRRIRYLKNKDKELEKQRKRRLENPEKIKEINHRSYMKNRDKYLPKKKQWREDRKESLKIRDGIRRRANKEKWAEMRKLRDEEIKREVIHHYSNGTMKCSCCGESNIVFLTLHHPDKDGAEHRKTLGNEKGGIKLYRRLKRLGFPDTPRLAVMCYNCNCADGFFGICPHAQTLITNMEVKPLS